MLRLKSSFPLMLVAAAACASPREESALPDSSAATTDENPVVILETSVGNIEMELFPADAPETVANFLRYVRGGFYDGLVFHRVKRNFMIQAGSVTESGSTRSTNLFPIANEAENGLKNVRGALAMARTGDPHSATSEFFINHVDNPELDFTARTPAGWGYAVFGRVITGMEVVDSIAVAPTERRGRRADFPVNPVVIRRAFLR